MSTFSASTHVLTASPANDRFNASSIDLNHPSIDPDTLLRDILCYLSADGNDDNGQQLGPSGVRHLRTSD